MVPHNDLQHKPYQYIYPQQGYDAQRRYMGNRYNGQRPYYANSSLPHHAMLAGNGSQAKNPDNFRP